MAVIIFIDTTTKSRSLISKFKDEGHSTLKEPLVLVNDVTNICTDGSGEKVLIWHVSSSKIRIDNEIQDVSLRNIGNATEILNRCQFNHKFGVTDNDEQYKRKVREAWSFDDVESWDPLKDRFKEGLKKGLKGQEKVIKATTNQILHLFLPIDIDMQALEMIQNDLGKVNKYLWGDKDRDIEGMFEGREGDEHYRQKLYDLWHLLGKKDHLRHIDKNASSKVEIFTPIDNSSPFLQKLAGLDDDDPKESPVYNFLESLDTGKKDDRDVTAEDLCKPFNLEIEVNGKKEEINSFHNWYCALASCLRGAEGCEGK